MVEIEAKLDKVRAWGARGSKAALLTPMRSPDPISCVATCVSLILPYLGKVHTPHAQVSAPGLLPSSGMGLGETPPTVPGLLRVAVRQRD